MESKKLNGYKIEFITKDEYCNLPMYENRDWLNDKVYVGLVSDISEDILDNIFDNSDFIDEKQCQCGERDTCYYCNSIWNSSKLELFQTLSKLAYCVITKIK